MSDPLNNDILGDLQEAPMPLEEQNTRTKAMRDIEDAADEWAVRLRKRQEQEADLERQLTAYRAAHQDTPPERQVDVLRYSIAMGLPPALVENQLDDLKKQVDSRSLAAALASRPQFAHLLTDAAKAPIAKDDAASLGWLEWGLTGKWELVPHRLAGPTPIVPGALETPDISVPLPEMKVGPAWARAFSDAIGEQKLVYLSGKQAAGQTTPEENKELDSLEEQYGEKDYGANNVLSKGIIGTAKMLPYMAGSMLARASGGLIGRGVGLVGGAAAGAETGPGDVGAAAGGAAAGATAGEYAGGVAFDFYQNFGPQFRQLKKLRDANGNALLSDDEARLYSAAASGASSLITGFVGDKVVKAVPGARQLLSRVAGKAITSALVENPTLAQSARNFALRYGEHALMGGVLMATQAGANQASVELANTKTGADPSLSNVAGAMKDAFARGLVDMSLIAALGPGREFLHERGVSARVAADAREYGILRQAAAESKLLERNPEEFQQHLERIQASSDHGATHVHIPVEEWVRYWQGNKADPGEVAAAVMEDGGKAFSEASATNGDLSIPTAQFLTKLGKTEHAEGLAQDVKLTADGRTPRQEAAFQKELEAQFRQQAKERADELDAGESEVHAYIRDQALGADLSRTEADGIARQVAKFARNMAVRLNVSVREAATLGALHQLRILGPKGEAIANAAQRRFRERLAPTASEHLSERLKSLGPEARARELYIDSNTGLLNEDAFNELPAPADKPLVGHISVEGIKYLNDSVSHDKADLLYRAVARALHSVDPGAAKVGGDFAVRLSSEKELGQVLERVRAALPEQIRDAFEVTGAVGKTLKDAGNAHRTAIDERVGKGERANPRPPDPANPKGKPLPPQKPHGLERLGLDAAAITFPQERAAAGVPPELMQGIEARSDKAYFERAYVEPKTGLLTAKGWDAIPRKAHVAAIDLKGLRKINELFGDATGDEILLQFGKVASHYGGSSFDFAHLHGDEYAMQHDDRAALEAMVARLEQRLQNVGVHDAILKSTGERVTLPIEFRHGIGEKTYEAADADLNARKQLEAQTAHDGGAREAAAGGPRHERSQDHDRGRGDLAGGGEALGRGATPQGYPGAREAGLPVAHLEGVSVTFNEAATKPGEPPRGYIQLQLEPGGRPVSFDVHVLRGADKSTAAHEIGHFLSWSLHEIATSDLATEAVRADYAQLLKWAGYDSPAERLAATRERAALVRQGEQLDDAGKARLKALEAKEERISHGWEQYLAEGKAPSRALVGVFGRFKAWMLRIYKGITGIEQQFRALYGEDLGLTDDVRKLFDRLLAAEDALRDAEEKTAVGALAGITSGMTLPERAAYNRALLDAHQSADQEVGIHAVEVFKEQVTQERSKVREQVAAELDKENPAYRALRFFETGELLNPEDGSTVPVPDFLRDDDGSPLRVNRADFRQKYGRDAEQLLPRAAFGKTKNEGRPLDELAPFIGGFESGQQLLDILQGAEPRAEAIDRETQARMDQLYAPAIQELSDAAMKAVHNDAAAQAALLEVAAIAREVNPEAPQKVHPEDLSSYRTAAETIVNESRLGDLNPERYARAERQAALKRAKLYGAGDKAGALEQANARLLNQLLYTQARRAKESLERSRTKLEATSDNIRGNLGKADLSFRDVHDQLLEAVGLAAPAPGEQRLGLDALLERAKADALDVDFDVEAVRQVLADPKPWDSLSVADARAVADAIINIRHLAALKNQVTLAGVRQSKDEFFDDMRTHLEQRVPVSAQPLSRTAEGPKDKLAHLGRGALAVLTDAETLAAMLDNHDRQGPAHRLMVDARLEARAKARELERAVLKPIQAAFEKMPKDVQKLRDRQVDVGHLLPIPEEVADRIAPVFTRDTLWSLFLNWGNEGNRQRVRDGFGWSDANVEKALGLLTEPELQYLQTVLDTIGSLYPEIARVHRGRTGLELDQVEATPIRINGKEYSGGYFPLRYDPRFSRTGEVQEGDVVASIFAPNYVRPATARGHTKGRVEKVSAPVDLTWGVVPAHLTQVIHDIAYGDWVRQAGGLLMDERFKALATQYLGAERQKEFVPWLRDVANARADSAAATNAAFLQEIAGFARNRVAVAAMAHNLPVIAGNLTDPLRAVLEGVPLQQVALAWVKVQNPANWGRMPELRLSKELEYREAQLHGNMRKELQDIGPTGNGLGRAVSETHFFLFEHLDRFLTRVTFKAAFDHGKSQGLSDADAAARADDVVRRLAPSHEVAEKAAILRSKKGMAGYLMFYGWANKNFNLLYRHFDQAFQTFVSPNSSTKDKARRAASFAGAVMALSAIGVGSKYLMGRGPTDDESTVDWAALSALLEPLNTVPFIGPYAEALLTGKKANARLAPELAVVQDSLNGLGDAYTKSQKGSTSDADKVWAWVRALLVLTPAGVQTKKTGGYVKDLATGAAKPRGALDVAGGLIYGERKGQGGNVFTDAEDVVTGTHQQPR